MPRGSGPSAPDRTPERKSCGERTPEKKSRGERTPERKAETVKVIVRCRPLNPKEISSGFEKTVDIDTKRGHISLKNPKASHDPPREFTFDAVYDESSKQVDLYDETFRPLVDSVLEGFNGTIFAYGQTGTGKTYTMEGVRDDPELRGVIPSSFEHIFDHIGRSENMQYLVRASYLEIYQEEIRDLLSKDQNRRLDLKERPDTGTYVKDLSSFVCKGVKEIEHVMAVGNKNRSTGATNMNEHSSRSHAIFMVTVECSEMDADGETHIRVGKLNMVDLAGSERQAKTGATGERLKEATKINLSLSALGNVISALVDGKSTHVPYRDSKLTRLLQDSLGGNARTIMVANMGPAAYNYDESLSTLRYANRAKNIKNKPKINEDPKDALLREFQEEIGKLKAQLQAKSTGTRTPSNTNSGPRKKGRARSAQEPQPQPQELTPEEFLQQERGRLEQERSAILGDTSLIAEDKERLLEEMRRKEEELERERSAKQQLVQRIKEMESKLLSGGKNIADRTNKQQRQLDVSRQKIAEQKAREREMLQRIEEQEGTRLDLQQTFQSLQQEVDVKTKKLKKLFAKLQSVKRDIADATEEFHAERRELEEAHIALRKELKLKQVIIENFVSPEELATLLARAEYREEGDGGREEGWLLAPRRQAALAQRPVSARGGRRPVSEYARTAGAVTGSTRFKVRPRRAHVYVAIHTV